MSTPGQAASKDSFVDLAARAVRRFVLAGETLPVPDPIPDEMRGRAGVFVSIKKHGRLRGCIGTFLPVTATVAHETIANAIQSASQDPRFPPVSADELDDLTLSVDVLSEPEPCDASQLDTSRFGVIARSGWRRGLLLPRLDGVDTVSEQLDIVRQKAGIGPDEPVELSRFTVERHT
jgi:AmmeMemoRadiSam system protein A